MIVFSKTSCINIYVYYVCTMHVYCIRVYMWHVHLCTCVHVCAGIYMDVHLHRLVTVCTSVCMHVSTHF